MRRTGAPASRASPADAADAKSLLQEWAQGQGLELPAYVEVDRQGPDHAPRFTAEVRISGRKPARGEGASKRAAEQAAATALLAREGVWKRAPMPDDRTPATRCGFIAVIGAPNAGKSTLVNTLVGAKVAIVSRKVQTTRMPVRGIAIEGASQLVFIDTPGIFAPRRRLDRAMVARGLGRSRRMPTSVLLIVDAAKGIDEDVERILGELEGMPRPALLALNKIDRVKKGAAARAGGRPQRHACRLPPLS